MSRCCYCRDTATVFSVCSLLTEITIPIWENRSHALTVLIHTTFQCIISNRNICELFSCFVSVSNTEFFLRVFAYTWIVFTHWKVFLCTFNRTIMLHITVSHTFVCHNICSPFWYSFTLTHSKPFTRGVYYTRIGYNKQAKHWHHDLHTPDHSVPVPVCVLGSKCICDTHAKRA